MIRLPSVVTPSIGLGRSQTSTRTPALHRTARGRLVLLALGTLILYALLMASFAGGVQYAAVPPKVVGGLVASLAGFRGAAAPISTFRAHIGGIDPNAPASFAVDAANSPKPGEGPSKEERETGNYDVLFVGEWPDGRTLCYGVKGRYDPGYGSTSSRRPCATS